jgi:thiol-disulfide isomerase/thioredoxin
LPVPPAQDSGDRDPLKDGGMADMEAKGSGGRPPEAADSRPAQWDNPSERQGPKSFPENIAGGEPAIPRSPLIKVPGGDPVPPPPQRPQGMPESLPAAPGAFSDMKTPIPSCAILGSQVVNFALLDVYGKPWEFKKDRVGKLVQLDFWKTSCIPCRQTIPHLRILQERHGPSGLEVISIASEQEGSFEQQRNKVAGVCNRYQTNYRLLLNSGPGDAQFLAKFNIQIYPTMMLLDERGQILWRHEGSLSRSDLEALESHIRLRLGTR